MATRTVYRVPLDHRDVGRLTELQGSTGWSAIFGEWVREDVEQAGAWPGQGSHLSRSEAARFVSVSVPGTLRDALHRRRGELRVADYLRGLVLHHLDSEMGPSAAAPEEPPQHRAPTGQGRQQPPLPVLRRPHLDVALRLRTWDYIQAAEEALRVMPVRLDIRDQDDLATLDEHLRSGETRISTVVCPGRDDHRLLHAAMDVIEAAAKDMEVRLAGYLWVDFLGLPSAVDARALLAVFPSR